MLRLPRVGGYNGIDGNRRPSFSLSLSLPSSLALDWRRMDELQVEIQRSDIVFSAAARSDRLTHFYGRKNAVQKPSSKLAATLAGRSKGVSRDATDKERHLLERQALRTIFSVSVLYLNLDFGSDAKRPLTTLPRRRKLSCSFIDGRTGEATARASTVVNELNIPSDIYPPCSNIRAFTARARDNSFYAVIYKSSDATTRLDSVPG